MQKEKIEASFNNLKTYCEKNEFKGWDPYDGLNSIIFQATPFSKNRFIRLAWTQFFKRSPINLRRVTKVPKEYNPKGLGLFITAYCNLYNIDPKAEYLEKIEFLVDQVISLQSEGWSGACWGYNFDWQSRSGFVPKYKPTIVNTTFIGYALLDAYEILKNDSILETALSISDFILKDLKRTYDDDGDFAFSYTPKGKSQVFNASLLGSKMLARIFAYTGNKVLIEEAKKSVTFCMKYQHEDGSWPYSTTSFHQWVDNFHTGFNLECIYEYQEYSGDLSFKTNLEKGLKYYLNTFFTDEGKPKYYNNSLYPIDIHTTAQLIVTLFKLEKLKENHDLVNRVLNWTIKNMQDEEGYFYYQINRNFTSKISYMRWSQAWMMYAMSYYLRYQTSK